MRFLRTASTARLLATIAAALVVIAAGAAIAVAATGSGSTPPAASLARAVRSALVAGRQQPVTGVSADITFTNNLIDSSDFTGQATDPLLQGASGRLWWSDDGRLRIELQSDDGDAQIVVDHRAWWISDPAENVVYEGTLPAGPGTTHSSTETIPTIAQISTEITKLLGSVDIAGPEPTNVAGQPAYRVTVSPKTSAGLLGSVQLAWDAVRGIPLQFALYARGNTAPVLSLQATSISYGPVAGSVFAVTPPAGAKIVQLGSMRSAGSWKRGPGANGGGFWTGVRFHVPKTLGGQKLVSMRPLGRGDVATGAILRYGTGLGAIIVIETGASATTSTNAPSPGLDGLSLPTRTIDGASATELSTALGTVLHLSRDGVSYTVLGSVPAATAEAAAGALAAGG